MSIDPVGGKPAIPSSWNRYTYGLNNPLRYIDPDGLDFVLVQNGEKVKGGDACKVEGTCDKDGNLIVKSSDLANPDSGVSGTVNENGVEITTAAGTFTGQFIAGTPSATLAGGGLFRGFTFTVTGDSGGRSIAEGRWSAPEGTRTLFERGGAVDRQFLTRRFHPGSATSYRFGQGPFAQLGEDRFPTVREAVRGRYGEGGMTGFFDVDKDPVSSVRHALCALRGIGCRF